jgi:hypothetical protein
LFNAESADAVDRGLKEGTIEGGEMITSVKSETRSTKFETNPKFECQNAQNKQSEDTISNLNKRVAISYTAG